MFLFRPRSIQTWFSRHAHLHHPAFKVLDFETVQSSLRKPLYLCCSRPYQAPQPSRRTQNLFQPCVLSDEGGNVR